jgi:hypothetical protein
LHLRQAVLRYHSIAILLSALIVAGSYGCSSKPESIRQTAGGNRNGQTLPSTGEDPPVLIPGPEWQEPRGSRGQGGATGFIESQFTASNQKSSNYKTRIPIDVSSKLYGLNIHLHGDGGGDYRWLFEDNVRFGLQHGLIGVVVLAPNPERRWYRQGEQNALFLHELVQNEIAKKYNIDLSRIYFSGVSGGSQFLTGQFIPLYGKRYRSGAVMLCGGPANWLRRLDMEEADINAFRLSWFATAGDFLLDQVEEGIQYYRSRGFPVTSEILPTGSHCSFPGGVNAALEKKLRDIVRPPSN